MLRRKSFSLRWYLLLLVLGAAVPGALFTSTLVGRTVAANRAVLERRLLDVARIDAAALDREFEGTIRALQALATSPLLHDGDLDGFYEEATRVQQVQASWYAVVVLSADGQQLMNTVRPWGEPLLKATEPESLKELVASWQPVVGRVRTDPRVPAAQRFAVRVPVVRAGELKYVLTAAINIESLATLVQPQGNDETWTRATLDPDGAVAARSREAHVVGPQVKPAVFATLTAKPEQVMRRPGLDGAAVYTAVRHTAFGWTALVVVPAAEIDAAARGSTLALITGGVGLMLGGLLAVLAISRRLQREFTSAARAADMLAEGRPLAMMTAHVTESQRLQDSLHRAAALLQQRERERDREIARAEAARAEAEEANRTKDQFLAVLGHELRNPLAPAITALEIMKRTDPNAFPRERQVLQRQLAHMMRLVDDLLDVSRLARGKVQLDFRRFELNDAVQRAVDMVRPLIDQQQHDLRVAVPTVGLTLDADEDRIVQVLVNLLVNAAKYTPPGGHISLAARTADASVLITCEDDGPGMPSDLATELFQPFAQGPRTLDRQHGGLGLGLALARSLTQLHDGTIHVENRAPDPGSRFVVRLPLAAGESAPAPAPEPEISASTGVGRILIVDDNADLRDTLGRAFQSMGQVVSTAADGPTAVSVAAGFQPDIAILDIGLPGMSGYELAGHLRRMYPNIRLIALTGYGRPADAEAAARAGFHSHLVKPVTLAKLLEHIHAGKSPRVGSQ